MIRNITCLKKVCEELGFEYQILDKNGEFIGVKKNEKILYFHNREIPVNSEIVSEIAKDKEFTFNILHEHLQMPKTQSYFDPEALPKYKEYINFKSNEEILKDIKANFQFPLVIKRNRGSLGNNVFLCNDDSEILVALNEIYNKESVDYDFIALVQNKISIQTEFRVITLFKEIPLIYIRGSKFMKDNPRRNEIIKNGTMEFNEIAEFIKPIFKYIDLNFGGLDVAKDEKGKLWLIELNTKPFMMTGEKGAEIWEEIYRKVLTKL